MSSGEASAMEDDGGKPMGSQILLKRRGHEHMCHSCHLGVVCLGSLNSTGPDTNPA